MDRKEKPRTANDRIRVLHLLGTARAGGVETFVLELARHIDRSRFDLSVCIIGSHGPMVDELRANAAGVRVLGIQKSFWRHALAYFLYVRAGRFDILHANVGGRLPRYLARLAGCHVIITHVHGPADEEVEAWRRGSRSCGPRIKRTYFAGTHHLVSCSHAVARMMIACCPALAGRVLVIPYGVDLDRFQPALPDSPVVKALRHELGLQDGHSIIGFVGRLAAQKGLRHLVSAAELLQKRYANLHFLIVGDGPLGIEFKAATALLGENRFSFLGERYDVPDLLALFDVLVVPSEWEGTPIVNLEAMAVATPVVAFDVDGIPETIAHSETGLLVPYQDTQGLASAIAQLLDDVSLRRRMGAAGRQRVEQMFDVRGMVRTFESIYETTTCRSGNFRKLEPPAGFRGIENGGGLDPQIFPPAR